jgi:GntR family transcriptional regulator
MAQLHSGGIDVDRVSLTLETRMPTENETDELAIPPGTPVYEHWRVMHSNGEPVEVSTAVVPGDRVAYTLDVPLTGGAR